MYQEHGLVTSWEGKVPTYVIHLGLHEKHYVVLSRPPRGSGSSSKTRTWRGAEPQRLRLRSIPRNDQAGQVADTRPPLPRRKRTQLAQDSRPPLQRCKKSDRSDSQTARPDSPPETGAPPMPVSPQVVQPMVPTATLPSPAPHARSKRLSRPGSSICQ